MVKKTARIRNPKEISFLVSTQVHNVHQLCRHGLNIGYTGRKTSNTATAVVITMLVAGSVVGKQAAVVLNQHFV